MEALLYGEFDDDDDDDDDDESFKEGKSVEGSIQEVIDEDEDEDDDDDDDDDDYDPSKPPAADGAAAAPAASVGRLPLHSYACSGNAEKLAAALAEGKETGRVTTAVLAEGVTRSCSYDPDHPNRDAAPPLHAAILAAVELVTLAAADPADPWVRAAVGDPHKLIRTADDAATPAPLAPLAPAAAAAVETAAAAAATLAAADILACAKLLLEAGAEPTRRVFGRSALHLVAAAAALPAASALTSRLTELLLAHGASLTDRDACGMTPLHYAATCAPTPAGVAHVSCLAALLRHEGAVAALGLVDRAGASALHAALRGGAGCEAAALALIGAGAPLDLADHDGLTPLHLAAAAGLGAPLRALLDAGAAKTPADLHGRTPAVLAGVCGRAEAHALLEGKSPPDAGAPYLGRYPIPVTRTLLLAHPASLLHAAPAGPLAAALSKSAEAELFGQPECAARLRGLLSPCGHLRGVAYTGLAWRAAPSAAITDVLRCHEHAYLARVKALCDTVRKEGKAKGSLDGDTEVTAHSYTAAMRGAGAAVEAVRAVCSKEVRSAFCAIRPPGHHAGPRGACGGQSAGFCIVSNAAIAAAYALHVHRTLVKKVAIVDFDVHHGNGTEACVRAVRPQPWVQDHETPSGTVRISGTTFQPWLDEKTDGKNVFFGSIHGYGVEGGGGDDEEDDEPAGVFYPGSGGPGTDSRPSSPGPTVRNAPMPLRTPSATWRHSMIEHLLNPLADFEPDLLVISAGFDAHAHDPLDAGGLHDRDYEWMTAELVRIAETSAAGRVVSVLEGGYQVAGGFVSSLSRAVGAHVTTLMQPSLIGASYDSAGAVERLEALLAKEEGWAAQRDAAAAEAAEALGEAPPAPQQDDGAPARRSKRARVEVDYETLDAAMEKEGGAAAEA